MRIGQRVGEEYGVQYLLSDFKKKNGYKGDPSNCPGSMVFTVRIIVDVSSPIKHVRQKKCV